MKRNVKIRIICLAVACMTLFGAITVAAMQGSPYETLRDAAFALPSMTNYTATSAITMKVDGVVREITSDSTVQTEEGSLDYDFDEQGNPNGFYYRTDSLYISGRDMRDAGGELWYSASVYPTSRYYAGDYSMLGSANQTRFYELLIDLLVGDMKNNLTMSTSGGVSTVRGAFTEAQIPEIIKAGLNLFADGASYRLGDRSRSDYIAGGRETWEMPLQSLRLDKVEGEADIDADGNITRIEFYAGVTLTNIFGDVNFIEVEGSAEYTDIGSSVLVCPIPGAEELLTLDYVMENFPGDDSERMLYSMQLYFKLNDDGSINAASVTPMSPYSPTSPYPPRDGASYIPDVEVGDAADIPDVEIGYDTDDDADAGADVDGAETDADADDVDDAGGADVADMF